MMSVQEKIIAELRAKVRRDAPEFNDDDYIQLPIKSYGKEKRK